MNVKKVKPYAVTAGVALAGIWLLNTLAKRNQTVAQVKNTIFSGS